MSILTREELTAMSEGGKLPHKTQGAIKLFLSYGHSPAPPAWTPEDEARDRARTLNQIVAYLREDRKNGVLSADTHQKLSATFQHAFDSLSQQ